jgi:hypothetical protein
MEESDRAEFARNLHILAGLNSKKLDGIQVGAYWDSLKGFTLQQVLRAIERCINEEKRFPNPAVMRSKMAHREIPLWVAIDYSDFDRAGEDHAKLGFKLIDKITKERMGPTKRLEAFRYMAKKFPGVGWEEAVADTERIVANAPK